MGNMPIALNWGSQSHKLYLIVGIVLATLWGTIFFDLDRAQKEVLAGSSSDLTNLSLAFSKEIESSVKTIDVTLIDLREHWHGDSAHFSQAVRSRQSYLEKELAFQVAVVDAKGKLVFSSLEQPAQPVDLSDREHIRIHLQRTADELFISKPLLGRVSKRWSIQFTRPIFDKQNTLSGVLVLSVSPEYFYRFYRSIRLLPGSAITLVNQDGALLARFPDPESALGKNLTDTPFLTSVFTEAGIYQRTSQLDGIERMFAWRRIERYNLVVVIGHALGEIMMPYREQRTRALLAGLGITVLLLLVGYLNLVSIKQRAREERLLAENEERWRLALAAAGDGVWDWNMENNQVVFSTGWKTILGYDQDEIGSHLEEWRKRVHPDDMGKTMATMQNHLSGTTATYANEHRMLCKDGSWKWILERGMVIARDTSGAPLRMVGTHTDISTRKEMEEKLTVLATIDALTGLNNRRCFLEKLETELARVRRYPQSNACVLMADIDFFKKINDTHGHEAGDTALRHFAKLLRDSLRESDSVGRLGGEEFAVLLPETSLSNAEQLAQRLCDLLRRAPVAMGVQSIPMTVSIGISVISPTDLAPEQVLHRADLALYQAKHLGRDQVATNLDNEPSIVSKAVPELGLSS